MPEEESPTPAPPRRPGRRRWRAATLTAFAAAAGLMVTSALQADGLDLRVTSVTDLHTLVQQQRDRVDAKQQRLAELTREVSRLGESVDDQQTRKTQRQARRLRAPAGFTEISGAGLKVTMSDTPKELAHDLLGQDIMVGDRELVGDDLVVHQQDIQAVVNALWQGGARGITLMGHRIITTTGIKCVGNTVIIKDIPYAPPYEIEAVGDPVELQAALDANPRVSAWIDAVYAFGLVWGVESDSDLTLPAYSGSSELRYAEPAAS